MKITITEDALKELNNKIGGQNGYLKLQNVTDGLACDSGVPTLLFVSSIDEKADLLIETNNRPVLMEKADLIFFDEELKIDYSDSANSFRLTSPQQIVNGVMSFVSKVH